MRQAIVNEALQSNPPYFRAEAFAEDRWGAIVPSSRQRSEKEEEKLTEGFLLAMRACQLSAKRNGIDKLTVEEFDELVYGD